MLGVGPHILSHISEASGSATTFAIPKGPLGLSGLNGLQIAPTLSPIKTIIRGLVKVMMMFYLSSI
jgi:hypothetical protein